MSTAPSETISPAEQTDQKKGQVFQQVIKVCFWREVCLRVFLSPVICLCSDMFSTQSERFKQEAMMDSVWQNGLVHTSSRDRPAAAAWRNVSSS